MPHNRDPFESTSWESASTASMSLADLCTDSFALIFHVHAGKDPGHIDSLRKEIAILLEDLEKRAKRPGHVEEEIRATRYALCALIDETVLNSSWGFKDQWA